MKIEHKQYKQKSFICTWCKSGFDDETLYNEHREYQHGDFGATERLNAKMAIKKEQETEKPELQNGFGFLKNQQYAPCGNRIQIEKTGNPNFAPIEEHHLAIDTNCSTITYDLVCKNCGHVIHITGSPTTKKKTIDGQLLLCPLCDRNIFKKAKEQKRKGSIKYFKEFKRGM